MIAPNNAVNEIPHSLPRVIRYTSQQWIFLDSSWNVKHNTDISSCQRIFCSNHMSIIWRRQGWTIETKRAHVDISPDRRLFVVCKTKNKKNNNPTTPKPLERSSGWVTGHAICLILTMQPSAWNPSVTKRMCTFFLTMATFFNSLTNFNTGGRSINT